MRTTLDIDDDVLQAAKEIAEREKSTAGRVLSALARKALVGPSSSKPRTKNGVPVLPSRGDVISMEDVQNIADDEGVASSAGR